MDFIICQVGRLTGNIDGIFNRNILQNIQIPQFTANMLCGKALEDTEKMLAFLNTYAHEHTDTRFVWDFFFFFLPWSKSSQGKRRWNSLQPSFCSSLVTKAFRLQGCINPPLLFVFFDNEAVPAFTALFPMENVIPCSGKWIYVCHSPASCCYSPGPSFLC